MISTTSNFRSFISTFVHAMFLVCAGYWDVDFSVKEFSLDYGLNLDDYDEFGYNTRVPVSNCQGSFGSAKNHRRPINGHLPECIVSLRPRLAPSFVLG